MGLRCTSACAALLLSACAHGAGAEGAVRASADVSVDSNARRDFLQKGVQPDVVGSVLASLQGRASTGRAAAWGSYDVGVRKFALLPSEDSVVNSAALEGAVALSRWLRAGLEARGKDRRGGERSYSDLSGDGFVELAPDAQVEVRLRGGAHRFLYWPAFQYSYSATELGATARYRFDRRHSVTASGDMGFRAYNAEARGPPPPGGELPQVLGQRRDVTLGVGASYAFRGPFSLSVSYGYLELDSNSFGESMQRHRVAVNAGFRLPWKWTLLLLAAYQVTTYPDGIYLSPEIQPLFQDDESHNQLSVRLVRPLSEHLDLELGLAVFNNELRNNQLSYARQVGGVGLAFRM